MKTINEYIIDTQFENIVTLIESDMIAEENMVFESFNSSIIQKLAQAIWDCEKENNERKIESAKRDDEIYGTRFGSHKPNLVSFASIFGPTKITKYGKTSIAQGLKWSEIKDEDFKEYKPDDKELVSLIKKTYQKNGKADFIVMQDDNIINFIKAYNYENKSDSMYYFKASVKTTWGSNIPSSVKELKKKYYSYQERNLKANEVIDELKSLAEVEGTKVYALEITDDMLKDYSNKINDREESKKGVINYDKASLEIMLRKQKARYKAIVDEIKAKKLTDNKDALFDEIKKVNDEVVEFVKEILSKPEYLEDFYEAGDLMDNVARAYNLYYKAINGFQKSKKYRERMKKQIENSGKTWDEKNADVWDYDKSNAKDSIRKVEDYIKEIRNTLEKCKERLAEKN